MKRLMTLATCAAVGFAGFAAAQDKTIAEADVIVELEDAGNANALEYWPQIESDLETVLAEWIAPMQSGDGYDVKIRLSDVSLSGSTILTGEGEFNHIEGWVYVREQGEPSVVDSFKVIIDAQTGEFPAGPGYYILPGMDDFYVALLNGFADKTVRTIQEM